MTLSQTRLSELTLSADVQWKQAERAAEGSRRLN